MLKKNIFTDQVRSTREGYVFSRVCLFIRAGIPYMMHWYSCEGATLLHWEGSSGKETTFRPAQVKSGTR